MSSENIGGEYDDEEKTIKDKNKLDFGAPIRAGPATNNFEVKDTDIV